MVRRVVAAFATLACVGAHAQEVTLFGQFNLGGKPLLERVCPKVTSGLLRGTTAPVKELCWEEKPANQNGTRAGTILLPYSVKQMLPVWAEDAKITAIYLAQNLGYLQLVFNSRRKVEALKSVGERFGNPSYAGSENGTGWSRPDIEVQGMRSIDYVHAAWVTVNAVMVS